MESGKSCSNVARNSRESTLEDRGVHGATISWIHTVKDTDTLPHYCRRWWRGSSKFKATSHRDSFAKRSTSITPSFYCTVVYSTRSSGFLDHPLSTQSLNYCELFQIHLYYILLLLISIVILMYSLISRFHHSYSK